ncbi:MAG: DUF1573 domain-containing protein [Bacteroidaceae bacterium]|nr:DUF1573 domain-containing protein [Bacteroidaceae bacterium]
MKRILTFILSSFIISSSLAQGQNFVFSVNEKNHKFGNVLWKNPVTATFVVSNRSTSPFRITNLEADCNCTAVTVSSSEVPVGGNTKIKVTYDAKMLGTFIKNIRMKTDLNDKTYYLRVSGRVVADVNETETINKKGNEGEDYGKREVYAYKIGKLQLSTDNVDFGNVYQGETAKALLNIYNGGDEPYKPVVMRMPSYLSVSCEPEVIRRGETGTLTFAFNTNEFIDYGIKRDKVFLSLYDGDLMEKDNEVEFTATILPLINSVGNDLSSMPIAKIDTIVDFGQFKSKKKMFKTIEIKNIGHDDLVLSHVEPYNSGIADVEVKDATLKPNQKTKMRITITPDIFTDKGKRDILLLSNDPSRQKIIVHINVKP